MTTSNIRKDRGFALVQAKGAQIKRVTDDLYLVPSQTKSSGGHVVNTAEHSCTCPDHQARNEPCKHIYAVLYAQQQLTPPEPDAKTNTVTYRQDWPAYNRAQTVEQERVQVLLRGLCDGIQQPPQKTGRPRVLLADVVYGATMKVYSTFSGRRAMSDLRACEARGQMERAPAYNTLFRYVELPALTPLLVQLVEESAAPLVAIEKDFAADSTGFSTSTYGRWLDHKYGGEKRKQRWVKVHAMVGTVTRIITAVKVTDGDEADCPELPALLTTTKERFTLHEVSADKAYLSNENLEAIEAAGAVPYIPFKSNSTPTSNTEAWARMYHYFAMNRPEFLAHYHKRSNVETAFSSVKRRFGGSVRSKLLAAQFNEAVLKCLCHNLATLVHAIHEFGIEPKFWAPRMEVVK